MIADTNITALPVATRVSFLTTHVTAAQAAVTALSPTGATAGQYNDAVLELARLNYWLKAAKTARA